MWTLILTFLWKLLTGEVYGLWVAHKAKEAQQIAANSPETRKELEDDLREVKL